LIGVTDDGSGIQVVAAGAKFNLRRDNGSSRNGINGYSSDGELSRISKSGGFSSVTEVERDPSCVSFTTFNILAPIYKRIDPQVLCCVFFLKFYCVHMVWMRVV